MKKVLGLDIGVASIGWAYINEPENENEQYAIINMGSRIIPLNPDESDEYTKGNAISKNANRRIKRGMRRGNHRYKMRKWKLNTKLAELNMLPDKSLFGLNSIELYGLRSKAIIEQLSLQELGRIFYHLNQKRGYKSNRKANNDEEQTTETTKPTKEGIEPKQKKKGYLDLINDREQLIKEKNLTIGQYFHQELLQNFRFRIKENIFLRKSYEAEFNAIWDKQKEYYPTILTNENYKVFFHEIIYYQRPLKSQKNLIAECRYEYYHLKNKTGQLLRDDNGHLKTIRPKAAPKSSPIFQLAKIWQDINHLSIKDKVNNDIEITLLQKNELVNYLNANDKISVTQLKKQLGLTPSDNFYINLKKDSLEGNKTYALIKKALGNKREDVLQFNIRTTVHQIANKETGELIELPVIDTSFEHEPLYRLWHLLYSVEETENLIEKLIESFGFTEEQAKALSKLDFSKGGYGSISTKAYRKIIPQLLTGLTYSDACTKAGYRHSDYLTLEENAQRQLDNRLTLYSKNTLRNPVVEKIINQVINLVNAILNDENLGRPDEIRVELGRELKQNAEERNNNYSRNNKQNKRHNDIAERLQKELGFKTVSRRDIERVKLWEEFGEVSPYEPTKPISLKDLFSGAYEIEHIIPKSRLFDDSFSNKTIASRYLNEIKDNETACDYMESRGSQDFYEYTEFIKKHFYKKDGISRTKLNYLLMPGNKIPQDFINRQMRETAYISREIKNLLSRVCRNVYTTSGGVTDYLRESWGVNNILQYLNFEKYKSANLTETITIEREDGSIHAKEIIKKDAWSKRDDHRHHAIDALVIALTKQSYIQKLNLLNQNYRNQKELRESERKFELPWKGFVNDAIKATDNILISFKAGKKVATLNTNKVKKGNLTVKEMQTFTPRGFLHKETVYGQIKRFEKIKLSPKFNRWDELANPAIKEQLLKRLSTFDHNPNLAFKDTDKTPLPNHLKEISLYRYEYVLRRELDGNFKAEKAKDIVDTRIKAIVLKRLSACNNNPKEAFLKPLYLNEGKGIEIKSVRCFEGYEELTPLHTNEKGEGIDFVITRNNHHIALYKDAEGKLQENVVTFWDALERKKNNFPVVIKNTKEIWDKILTTGFDNQEILKKLPKDNWEFITSLSQNEMFVFGLDNEDLEKIISEKRFTEISKSLHRVQKISEGYYNFRSHLYTKTDENKSLRGITWERTQSLEAFKQKKPIKVKINNLGKIVKIGD